MTKKEYLLKQFSKTNKKNMENYVITRIWHKLNSSDYKIVTQQYVKRDENQYALTDLFFPQLNIHIEVNEDHHLNKNNILNDQIREKDIITNLENHKIISIDCSKDIEQINKQVDDVVQEIKREKNKKGKNFKIWNPELESNSNTYIDKGFISLENDVAFNNIVNAINCFGVNYKGFQKGGLLHPKEEKTLIWFPKLYDNEDWENSISDDEEIIYEKKIRDPKVHLDEIIKNEVHFRIVFARVIDNLGSILYKFKGRYKLNLEKSKKEDKLIWERIAKKVKTYRND